MPINQSRFSLRTAHPKALAKKYFDGLPREVLALTGVSFSVALGFGIVSPVIPAFAKTFGVSTFASSAVISVFAAMRLLGASPAGWLINRIGERAVLWIGLSIVSVSSFLAGISQTYSQLIVLRGLGGIGSVMFTVSALSLLLRLVDSEHRGRASGTYQSGFLFGGLAGPALGSFVVSISIRAPFFVYAGTLLMAAFVAYFALPKGLGNPKLDETLSQNDSTESAELKKVMRFYAYWVALAITFTSAASGFGLRSSLIPIFVTDALGKTLSYSSFGFLLSSITTAMFLIPAGRLVDLKGRRLPLIIGISALSASLLLLTLYETTWTFLLSMMLGGLAGAFLGSAPSAVIGDIIGKQRGGNVVAAYQMMSDFGMIVGPLILGELRDSTGSFVAPFTAALVLSLITLVFVARMKETKNRVFVFAEK